MLSRNTDGCFFFFSSHFFAAGTRSWTVVLGNLQAKATKGLFYWAVSRQRNDCFTGQSPGKGKGGAPNPNHALSERAGVRLGVAGSRGMWERNSLHAGRKPSTLLWDEVSSHNKLAARAVKVAWTRIADHGCSMERLFYQTLIAVFRSKLRCRTPTIIQTNIWGSMAFNFENLLVALWAPTGHKLESTIA